MTGRKRMYYHGLRNIFTGVFSFLLIAAYAQEGVKNQEESRQTERNETGTSMMDSITVVRDYRPMLADAVKIRRTPDMKIDRKALEAEMRQTAAAMYFQKNRYKEAYHMPLPQKYPNAKGSNIDNNRIGILAYRAGEFERSKSILEKVEPLDAFYQSSLIALGHIAVQTGDKSRARNAFYKASRLNYDQELKVDALFNYGKVLCELDSVQNSIQPLREFIALKYPGHYTDAEKAETVEMRLADVLSGTSNFQAAVYFLESFQDRDREADRVYQKITYYRGWEFYNERAFENSISMFMRSEKFPFDEEMAALAIYWKAEAMYEVRKYGEAVENFSRFLRLPAARQTSVYNYANYALAYAAFRINRYNMASEHFERYLASEESLSDKNIQYDVMARLGDSYLSMRNYGKAKDYYNQLIREKAPNQDYALFQQGIIQGLQGDKEAKLKTLRAVVERFPNSNYADDVAFEIPYMYFTSGDYDAAIDGLQKMIKKYPRSSYVPRALMTIGLVQYTKNDNQAALATFEKVVKDYATTGEAAQALHSIENIYLDQGDATSYIRYATSTNVRDLSASELDNLAFQAGNTLFSRGQYAAAVEAINAYFDQFPKPRQDKHARYIRGVSLYHTGHPEEALHDLNMILNTWTSPYTKNTLVTVAALYLSLKQYNEAIVHLKKLELNTDYKDKYGYAVTNLMLCYYEIGDFEQMNKYVKLINNYNRATDDELAMAHLYTAKAKQKSGDKESAMKELNLAAQKSQSAASAEARYLVGLKQYEDKQYDKAEKSAFDVIENMDSQEYWVAKSFILLADTYARKGNTLQARSTLESVIENYTEDDDIVPSAKERLQKLKK
ncbi:tetratricopeptide repeat protein [Sphingobacterium sp. lm-10]|uniref:tetratricopeptide repeat protein n=1 Tax=Sphingobacterium sp. lm-10 TaxID=2944904 RepID=UPI0020224192|nr:tetratricopeptide repeat protein [Sphingobacterium sp. lm-10]MCL7987100.1 tetratricopeptide repeat protein [Sphingobacterium sp. lm-10]